MYCIHCGEKLRDGARFCTACGKPVRNATPAAVPTEAQKTELETKVKEKVTDFAKAGTKQILSALKDLDISASEQAGEIRCKADSAQSAFMKLIKKGVLMLAIFSTLAFDMAAQPALGSKTGQFSIKAYDTEVKYTLEFEGFKTAGEKFHCANGRRYYSDDQKSMQDWISGYFFKDYITVHVKGAAVSDVDGLGYVVSVSPRIWGNKYKNRKWMGAARPDMDKSSGWKPLSKGIDETFKIPSAPKDSLLDLRISIGLSYEGSLTLASGKHDIMLAYAESDNKYIDSNADENSGESGWAVPVLVIGGLAVGGIVLKRRKKQKPAARKSSEPVKKKEEEKKEEDDDDDDDEETATYEMRIKKDFGDTLTPGASPENVYARIVRISADGKESTDRELTARISISGDDYLKVGPVGVSGDYVCASVEAPQKEDIPSEAVVNFCLSASGGSFTNRMHFKVSAPQIIFLQDDITLPACLEKKIFLSFMVDGLGEDPVVELSFDDKTYSASLEFDRDSGIYYAIISDNDKNPGVPGEKTRHQLVVTASGKGGKVKTVLPVYRFTMGLACKQLDHIDCFTEVYDFQKHQMKNLHTDGRIDRATTLVEDPVWEAVQITPAETQFWLTLYDYDEENNHIIAIPPHLTSYKIIADDIPTEYVPTPKSAAGMFDMSATIMGTVPGMGAVSTLLSGAATEIIGYRSPTELAQTAIDQLGISIAKYNEEKTSAEMDEHSIHCVFVCRTGILHKPNRIKATVVFEAEHNGRKYKLEQKVTLRSQPRRTDLDYAEMDRLVKRDRQVLDALEQIRSEIYRYHYANKLEALHTYIEDIIDNYDEHYGVDWQQARAVFRIYNRFLRGEMETAQSENENNILYDTVDGMLKFGKWTEDKLGFWGRLAIGVATMGVVDAAYNSLEVLENLKSYSDDGGDNAFIGFCLGAWVPIREYFWSYYTDKGLKKAQQYFAARKAGKKIIDESSEALVKKAAKSNAESAVKNTAKKGVEESAEKACHIGNQAERINAANKTAEKLAKSSEKASATGVKNLGSQNLVSGHSLESLMNLEKEGIEDAARQIYEFSALLKSNGGKHNKELFLKAIELQQNKNVLELLQFSKNPELVEIRKMFNYEMDLLHNRIDMEIRYRICDLHADKFGRDMSKIKTLNATTSTDAARKAGAKITFDRDSTYYIVLENGKRHYFNQSEIDELYSEALYKIAKDEGGSLSDYLKFMKACDQTVVQSDLHLESYGEKNLEVMLKSAKDAVYAAKALPDPVIVANATEYKCLEWYLAGMKLLQSGDRQAQKMGVAKIREGFRQAYKQFNNYLVPRNAARCIKNGRNVIPDEMFNIIAILKQTDVPSGNMSVGEAIFALRQKGISPEGVFENMKNIMLQIG